ncbi:Oidioi.mRNA.OKI2018_I69.chr2.g4319.t1.cds [Oikopleura dioica]|uniref:Oidioi.mRNA.OKI2018_I69.chr2.g4319.t1.cds n=1 Tax=Oikopleura dioica TaxID=34765 RepID=A0ABN7T3K1_OIKDI|nr:Oidioi.mRNA.OKI2018_I69.chr2.g4319.t1.cds [Oikopleura dioica]
MRSLIVSIFSAQRTLAAGFLNFNVEKTKKVCDYDPAYLCGENNELCGSWSCNGDSEDSTCNLICADGSTGGSRQCSCHKSHGRNKIFTGCKWRERSSPSFCQPVQIEDEENFKVENEETEEKEKVFDDFLSKIIIEKEAMEKSTIDEVFSGVFQKCEEQLPGLVHFFVDKIKN